jgi:hypothetical protein
MKDFWMTAPGSKAQRGAKSFDASIEALLRGKPLREKGQDFILSSDRRKVRMLNASSGQQELYPLLVVLKTLAYAVSYPTFLMIEEPEAHLFPKAQSDLMWLISKALNEMPSHSKVLITTHSPYVLATLNNQILAAHLDENRAKKSLRSYSEASLPADVVGASFIESGRISTIDREDYGLLDAGVIDSVSSEIADQTEMLMGEVLLG